MRILYVVHRFFPKSYYGTERFTLNLAKQMQKYGHHPRVLSFDPAPEADATRLQKGVYIKKYSYQNVPVISLSKIPFIPSYSRIFDPDIEEAFERLELPADIVHISHPMWLASAARVCDRNGIPIVLTLTDTWLLCPRALIDRNYRLCKGPLADGGCASHCAFDSKSTMLARYRESMSLLEMSGEIVTASEFTASTFKANGLDKPIRIVPHSIDYRFVTRIDRSPVETVNIAFIGSVTFQKGLHVLVKAMRKVPHENVRLRVYGSMSENAAYAKEILQISDGDNRISFPGEFEMEALPRIMKETSLLVVPSVYPDNYPLVILTAMAHSIPVLGSNIGGIPEMVGNGNNGFLFEPGNVDELASLINSIAREPGIINKLAANFRSPKRLEEEALEYENIYSRLINRSLDPHRTQMDPTNNTGPTLGLNEAS
jgi:glycosyltransferase involved in cell wall biosynthesis